MDRRVLNVGGSGNHIGKYPRTGKRVLWLFAMSIALCGMAAGRMGGMATSELYAEEAHSYVPPNGFVPDAMTAIRIAEAVLIPVYGQETIATEKPLVATLDGNVWTIHGTLRQGEGGGFTRGGVAVVQLSKTDARVLRMTHGK
jgi:hypothetical protein